MTDKQIIIDGVNVSGCEKQGETIAGITCGNGERIRFANEIITKHKLCKDNPNCYYKQLKRKEQEVQQAMDNYVQLDLQRVKEYNELVDLYKAKEQECEELKSDLTDLSKIIDCKNGTILTFEEQLDQLKQTLAEIEEIAMCIMDDDLEESSAYYNAKQILQQIS